MILKQRSVRLVGIIIIWMRPVSHVNRLIVLKISLILMDRLWFARLVHKKLKSLLLILKNVFLVPTGCVVTSIPILINRKGFVRIDHKE